MRKSKGLSQAYDLQDFAYSALMSLREKLRSPTGSLDITRDDAQAIAQLIKSWETAQDRIRIHRGKPLPGSLRPEKKSKAKPSALAVIEPMPDHAPEPQQSSAS